MVARYLFPSSLITGGLEGGWGCSHGYDSNNKLLIIAIGCVVERFKSVVGSMFSLLYQVSWNSKSSLLIELWFKTNEVAFLCLFFEIDSEWSPIADSAPLVRRNPAN